MTNSADSSSVRRTTRLVKAPSLPDQLSFSYNETCTCGQLMDLGDALWIGEQVFYHQTCMPSQRYCTTCRKSTRCVIKPCSGGLCWCVMTLYDEFALILIVNSLYCAECEEAYKSFKLGASSGVALPEEMK